MSAQPVEWDADDEAPEPLRLIPALPPDMDPKWWTRALCAQVDLEIMFPERGGSTREAKRLCAACDVSVECLTEALVTGDRWGIRGGLSEWERRPLLPLQARGGR